MAKRGESERRFVKIMKAREEIVPILKRKGFATFAEVKEIAEHNNISFETLIRALEGLDCTVDRVKREVRCL